MRIPRLLYSVVIAIALGLATAAPASAAQGVDGDEVVVGTHADLSGPLSTWGIAVRNGIEMAFAEANEAGGMNGRTVRLVVKDDGYESDRASEAVRELIETDEIFAVLSPLGTPTVQAAANVAIEHDILYLFPIAAAEQTATIESPMMFTLRQSHEMAVARGLDQIMDTRPNEKVGVISSNDAFGLSVRDGVIRQLATTGLSLTTDVTVADDVMDYRIPLGWLREQGVRIVVVGAMGEDVISMMQAARAMRWQPTFLCSFPCYTPELAALGGEVVEGLHAVGQVPIPYANDQKLGEWADRYEAEFGMIASKQALMAYRNARLFLDVLEQTGRTPTQENFRHVLETLEPWSDPLLEEAPIRFSPEDHAGDQDVFLVQVRNGRWVVVPRPNPSQL